jgi:hypothetical protein
MPGRTIDDQFLPETSFSPNIELKFISDDPDVYSFKNRIPLTIESRTFWIGPL